MSYCKRFKTSIARRLQADERGYRTYGLIATFASSTMSFGVP